MHNLTKIKIFRIVCIITYPIALLVVYPFVLTKTKNKSHLFFFFDRYVIGGAQRIHLDILKSVQDTNKQVYFTRRSNNKGLRQAFYVIPNTQFRDIHFWCDYLFFRPFSVHYYAFYINRHKKAHVFSSNSTFFYDLLPFLKSTVVRTELLHNFTHGKKGMEFFGLANYSYLTNRVVYDTYTLENIKKQYEYYNVPLKYLECLLFIEPGVEVPDDLEKDYKLPLKILYAGRGGDQKRIHLLNRVAEFCIKNKWNAEFNFAGTMIDELSPIVKDNSIIHGAVSEQGRMNELYSKNHSILMTSAYEGFPMLIKEGMAYGCVPVVTALKGNKMHLKDRENALLITDIENEENVIAEAICKIEELIKNQELLETLSTNAYKYARNKFQKEKFIAGYRELLL